MLERFWAVVISPDETLDALRVEVDAWIQSKYEDAPGQSRRGSTNGCENLTVIMCWICCLKATDSQLRIVVLL